MKTQARPSHAIVASPARTSAVSYEIVRSEEEFARFEGTWRRIVGEMVCKTPCFEWAYIQSWWAIFGRLCPVAKRPGQLYVVVVRQAEDVVGILPFFYTVHPRSSLFPRRLRLIGYSSRLEPYDMTEEPLAAIAPGHEEVVLQETAAAIRQVLGSGECDCCVFRWLDEVDPPAIDFAHSRFKRKEGSGYVSLPGSWQEFRKGLSKSMRDNLPYYGRLLVRQGHNWHVEIAEIGPDWDRAVQELVRLHRKRTWLSKNSARRDHLPSQAHKEFLDVVHDAFRHDARAFIGLLRVDGKVVAAQSYLEDSRTLMLSYSGHDPDWARYSPLLVLQAEVIKQAIERGMKRLDFLYGMAPWQERWQPTRDHPTNKLVMVAKKPLSVVRCLYYMLAKEIAVLWDRSPVKRWINRSRVVTASQSIMQAMYVAHFRHIHLLMNLHALRLHG